MLKNEVVEAEKASIVFFFSYLNYESYKQLMKLKKK